MIDTHIITIRSVYGKVGQHYFIQPCREKSGLYPSCVRKVNSTGDMILSDSDKMNVDALIPENATIDVFDGKTFNLEIPHEKAEWEAIKNCFLIAESRDAKDANGDYLIDGTRGNAAMPRYGKAELYIEIPGLLAVKKISFGKKVVQAKTFIMNDPKGYDGHLLIAKVLGRSMTNQTAAEVEEYLFDFAEQYPDKIISVYTGGDLSLQLLLVEALDKGVIYQSQGVYMYSKVNPTILGATQDSIIAWMKNAKNAKVLALIRKDVEACGK